MTQPFDAWMHTLEVRHLADLEFREVTRALRALSSVYVERRSALPGGSALASAGKRAAFALFYAPLHYLLLRAIAEQLPGARAISGPLVDLGCGTGGAGAGWATSCARSPTVLGVDRHPWAVTEASLSYRTLGLSGRAILGDVARDPLPKGRAYLAAFVLNELTQNLRTTLLERLLEHATRGHAVLVVEPVSRKAAPWWKQAAQPFIDAGGRTDEWRFKVALPPFVEKLDRAAGLDHREILGRSLWIPGS